MVLYIFCTGLLLLAILLFYLQTLNKNAFRITVPDGPAGWPIIGNVLEMLQNPHQVITSWAKKHGDIFKIKVFNEEIVVVNSAGLIREALVEKPGQFDGRPLRFRCQYALLGSTNVTFRDYGPEFSKLKKTTMKAIRNQQGRNGTANSRSSDIARDLVDAFMSYGEAEFDPRMDIYACVCNTICMMLLGEKLPMEHPHLKQVKEFDSLICQNLASGKGTELDMIPSLRFLPNASFKLLTKAKRMYMEFFDCYLPKLKASYTGGDDRCIVDELRKSLDENGRPSFDENTVLAESVEITIAGSSSSATAVYCLFNYAVHNPDIQSKLHQEIDRVVGKNRLPSAGDRRAMPYMEATIMETLRFISHLPFGVPHKTLVDTTLGGFNIPKQTQVLFNYWSVHHDERIWNDPWNFRPERFLDESNTELLPWESRERKSFMAFGLGKRTCMGESVARSMVFTLSSAILQQFTLIRGDSDRSSSPIHPDDFEDSIILEPTLYKLKAIPR